MRFGLLFCCALTLLGQQLTVTPATTTIVKRQGPRNPYYPTLDVTGPVGCSAEIIFSYGSAGTWNNSSYATWRLVPAGTLLSSGADFTVPNRIKVRLESSLYGWSETATLGAKTAWSVTVQGVAGTSCEGQQVAVSVGFTLIPALPDAVQSVIGETAATTSQCTNPDTALYSFTTQCSPTDELGESGTTPLTVAQTRTTYTDSLYGGTVTLLPVNTASLYPMVSSRSWNNTYMLVQTHAGDAGTGVIRYDDGTLVDSTDLSSGLLTGKYSWYTKGSGYSENNVLAIDWANGTIKRITTDLTPGGGQHTTPVTLYDSDLPICVRGYGAMSEEGMLAFTRQSSSQCNSTSYQKDVELCVINLHSSQGNGPLTPVCIAAPTNLPWTINTSIQFIVSSQDVNGYWYALYHGGSSTGTGAIVVYRFDGSSLTQITTGVEKPDNADADNDGDGLCESGEECYRYWTHCATGRDSAGNVKALCGLYAPSENQDNSFALATMNLSRLDPNNPPEAERGGPWRYLARWASSTNGSIHLSCASREPVCTVSDIASTATATGSGDGDSILYSGTWGFAVTNATAAASAVLTLSPTSPGTVLAINDKIVIGSTIKPGETSECWVTALRGTATITAVSGDTITVNKDTSACSGVTFTYNTSTGKMITLYEEKTYTKFPSRGNILAVSLDGDNPQIRRIAWSYAKPICIMAAVGTPTTCAAAANQAAGTGFWQLTQANLAQDASNVCWFTSMGYPAEARIACKAMPSPLFPTITHSVQAGSTSAVVNYSLPSVYASCEIKYGTAPNTLPPGTSSGLFTSTASCIGQRGQVVISGLTASTPGDTKRYYYQIRALDSGGRLQAQSRGSFITTLSESTTFVIRQRAASTTLSVAYGTTTALGSTASNTSCVAGQECAVTLTPTKGVVYYKVNGGQMMTAVAQ